MYTLKYESASGFESFFGYYIMPRVYAAGARPLAKFASFSRTNDVKGFEQLFEPPMLPKDHVFIRFARFPDVAAYDRYARALGRDTVWNDKVMPMVNRQLAAPTQVWRLVPVGHSRPIH